MKKISIFLITSLFCTALFLGCANASGDSGNYNGGETPDEKPETGDFGITIVKETFAGQVYYLDELDRNANRSAETDSSPSTGIDEDRDRIVFSKTGNGYTLYIGSKVYEGTYDVNLNTREIALTGNDSSNAAVELNGILKFSSDAKTVDFKGVEKDENGKETVIEKKGEIKWDWSELGEWIPETINYKYHPHNLSVDFDRTDDVQYWRGEIDFRNAEYLRGIKIPATCFSGVKEGDYITFLWQKEGYKRFFWRTDDLKFTERNWRRNVENYDYSIHPITQEHLNYINNNQGLNIYGDGAVLKGIIIGAEGADEMVITNLFSRMYSGGSYSEDWTLAFYLYIDDVYDRYCIDFNFTKNKEVDVNGLRDRSPDKCIYRRFYAAGDIKDLDGSIKVDERTFVLKDENLDKTFVTYWRANTADFLSYVELKEYIEDKLDMKFNIKKIEGEEKYTLEFIDVPFAVKECIDTFDESKKQLILRNSSGTFYSQEPMKVSHEDLSTIGEWTNETFETGTIQICEVECDFTNANYEKGFYIPKDKFTDLNTGDIVYFVFPVEGDNLDLSEDKGDSDYAPVIIQSWNYVNKNADDKLCAQRCNFSKEGIEYVNKNGLYIACNGNKLVKVFFGNAGAADEYFNSIRNK